MTHFDAGTFRQILSDHRQQLEALLEHWVTQQELSLSRANAASAQVSNDSADLAPSPPLLREDGPGHTLARKVGRVTFASRSSKTSSLSNALFMGVSPARAHAVLAAVTEHAHNAEVSSDGALNSSNFGSEKSPRMRYEWAKSQAASADDKVEQALGSMRPKLDMLARIVNHVIFETIVSGILLANVGIIGLRAEHQTWSARGSTGGLVVPWKLVESVFIVVYLLELMLRVLALRVKFFTGEDQSWNVFDVFLVAVSMPELLHVSDNVSYLRLWRILKLVKVLRIVRLARSFRELRLMLTSILGSMKALVWSMVLIAGTTYMVSIAFVLGTTDLIISSGWTLSDSGSLPWQFYDQDGMTHEVGAFEYFSSVFLGMRTLFATVTGGMDWLPLSIALWDLHGIYFLMLYSYICFFNFVILNTMTSLFLDGVMHHTENDTKTIVRELLNKKAMFMDSLRDVHRHMCGSNATEATLEAFNEHLADREMIHFARTLEVEVVDLQVVFDVLSNGGHQSVDLESFVVGCIRLRGNAKSVDLISLSIAQQKLANNCERQFAQLKTLISAFGAARGSLEAFVSVPQQDSTSGACGSAQPKVKDGPDLTPRATGGNPFWSHDGITS